MSLFDKLPQTTNFSRENQITFGPAESFAAIILIAVATDGYAKQEEMMLLNTILGQMKLFRSYSADVISKMFDNILGLLIEQGSSPVLDAAFKSLPRDLYDTVFANVADLVLADGQVTKEEQDLLDSLYRALEIPEHMAVQIINVMLIKNKG